MIFLAYDQFQVEESILLKQRFIALKPINKNQVEKSRERDPQDNVAHKCVLPPKRIKDLEIFIRKFGVTVSWLTDNHLVNVDVSQ